MNLNLENQLKKDGWSKCFYRLDRFEKIVKFKQTFWLHFKLVDNEISCELLIEKVNLCDPSVLDGREESIERRKLFEPITFEEVKEFEQEMVKVY